MTILFNKKALISFFLILLLLYAFIEPYWLELKETNIIDKDLPASFENTKIVFISDIHHGPYFSRERVRSLVQQINGLNPDIILLGGDYVFMDSKYIQPCFEELKNLKATIGKFGVLGNHDHWRSAELTRILARDAGIRLLDNKAEWVYKNGDRIKIGGVGDMFEDIQDITPTTFDVSKQDFVILLSHNPDFAEEIKTYNIDLVLSGHTHGGQVTLFGLWAPLVPIENKQKYRTGVVDTGYTKVIVSNGVGTTALPVRFFARPQINIINLKKEQ